MKLAVPTRGGIVDNHFGHCEAYTVFSIDEIAMVVNHKPKRNISPWLFHLAVKKQIIYK